MILDRTVLLRILEYILTGAPGSGKTCIKHMLYDLLPPEAHSSTSVHELCLVNKRYPSPPSRETTQDLIRKEPMHEDCNNFNSWTLVDSESNANPLFEMISNTVKAGKCKGLTPVGNTTNLPPVPTRANNPQLTQNMTRARSLRYCESQKLLLHNLGKNAVITDKCIQEFLWIYCRDSGGQSQFHDMLPKFINETSLIIYVINLSQTLDEQPLDDYYIEGQHIGDSKSPYQFEQVLKSIIQSACYKKDHNEKTNEVKLLIIGTHKDMITERESLNKKNEKLKSILHPFVEANKLQVLSYGDYNKGKLIFPINARDHDEESKCMAANIRNRIAEGTDGNFKPVEVPIGWFLLEKELRTFGSKRESDNGIIKIETYEKIAMNLNIPIEMALKALEFFHNHSVFLYFSDNESLSKYIFTKPQFVVKLISAFVQEAHRLSNGDMTDTTYYLRLTKLGLFSSGIFEKSAFASCLAPSAGFNASDAIELLKMMLVIAPINKDEYFVPIVLQHCPPDLVCQFILKESESFSECVAPIAIKPPGDGKCLPSGFFCAFVCSLLSIQHWEFLNQSDQSESRSDNVFKNFICLNVKAIGCHVAVVDMFNFIRIHVFGECHEEDCEKILKDINEAIKIVIHEHHYKVTSQEEATPQLSHDTTASPEQGVTFLCVCSKTSEHTATLTTEGTLKLICSLTNEHLGITEKHTVWFTDEQRSKWRKQLRHQNRGT